jgi:hypothetical protein
VDEAGAGLRELGEERRVRGGREGDRVTGLEDRAAQRDRPDHDVRHEHDLLSSTAQLIRRAAKSVNDGGGTAAGGA